MSGFGFGGIKSHGMAWLISFALGSGNKTQLIETVFALPGGFCACIIPGSLGGVAGQLGRTSERPGSLNEMSSSGTLIYLGL